MNLQNILTVILISCVLHSVSGKKLKCPLKWEPAAGITSAVPFAIPMFSGKPDNYIIRELIGGAYVIGNYPVSLQYGLLPNPLTGEADVTSNFQVLTNPHQCLISWEIDPDPEFNVVVGALTVSRVSYGGNLTGGFVKDDLATIVTTDFEIISLETDYQYMSSYLPGLVHESGNIELIHDEINPTYELMGVDEIHNRSPATVRQILDHKSRTYESTTVTTFSSWYSGSRFNFKASFSFKLLDFLEFTPGFNFHNQKDEEGSSSTTKHYAVEKELSVGREIEVRPYSSVQACSIIVKIKNFKATYESTDRYSAPGLTSAEVNQLLKDEGITSGVAEGDAILVPNSGEISADIFVTTRFFAYEINEGEETICSFYQK